MINSSLVFDHTAFKNHSKVEKTCHLLFQDANIDYFCYQRIYDDYHYTLLPSRADYGKYFLSPDIYPYTWLFNTKYEFFKSGYLFWNIAKEFIITEQQEKIYNLVSHDLKLTHGIDVIRKFDQYCDIYCFASEKNHIYFTDLNYLNQFIFYFNQEARKCLKQAWQEKIYLDNTTPSQNLPIIGLEQESFKENSSKLEIKKYYCSNHQGDIYLTSTEVLVLKLLAQGYSPKEVAQIHGGSHRTIEKHIANLKEKLGCSCLIEAINIARKNGILST